jgi:hypothetical protein
MGMRWGGRRTFTSISTNCMSVHRIVRCPVMRLRVLLPPHRHEMVAPLPRLMYESALFADWAGFLFTQMPNRHLGIDR